MISCNKGEVRVRGTKSDIKAELSCLLRSLVTHEGILTKEDLDNCVKFVDLTEEEIKSEMDKAILSMIFSEILLRSLKNAVENNDGENNDGEEDE